MWSQLGDNIVSVVLSAVSKWVFDLKTGGAHSAYPIKSLSCYRLTVYTPLTKQPSKNSRCSHSPVIWLGNFVAFERKVASTTFSNVFCFVFFLERCIHKIHLLYCWRSDGIQTFWIDVFNYYIHDWPHGAYSQLQLWGRTTKLIDHSSSWLINHFQGGIFQSHGWVGAELIDGKTHV